MKITQLELILIHLSRKNTFSEVELFSIFKFKSVDNNGLNIVFKIKNYFKSLACVIDFDSHM